MLILLAAEDSKKYQSKFGQVGRTRWCFFKTFNPPPSPAPPLNFAVLWPPSPLPPPPPPSTVLCCGLPAPYPPLSTVLCHAMPPRPGLMWPTRPT